MTTQFLRSLAFGFAAFGLASCGAQQQDEDVSQTKSVQPYEDCISFNYVTASLQNIGGSWRIVDGSHSMYDFGSNFAEGQKSLQIIKNSQARYSCYVKRPNAVFHYLLNSAGNAISGNLVPAEDCISFNPASVSAALVGGRWKLVQGSMLMLDFGVGLAAQQQANLTRTIVQNKRFDKQCFVGRPGPSFTYWKKTTILPPPPPPTAPVTLDTCGDYLAIAGGAFQCPGNSVAVGLFDRVQPITQFETVRCCTLRAAGASAIRIGGVTEVSKVFGGAGRCPANSFVSGVRFDAAGSFQGVLCQSLSASGRSIVRTGGESQSNLISGSGGVCSGHSLMIGVGDTIAPDGDIDNIRCQSGLRL